MSRLISGLSLLLLICSACQKKQLEVLPEDQFTINSTFTQQNYEIQVLLPEGYDPSLGYPSVYLIDAYYHFNDVRNSLASATDIADVILVGIFYRDYPFSLGDIGKIEKLREVDLTYPEHRNDDDSLIGGGGMAFANFIKDELIPQIEDRYNTDPGNRTLLGHSLGGYFALFQMIHFAEAPLFSKVVALSPSLWWANLAILQQEASAFDQGRDLPYQLYLGVAEQEGVETNVLVGTLEERLLSRNYSAFDFFIERYSGGHLASARKGFELALKHLF